MPAAHSTITFKPIMQIQDNLGFKMKWMNDGGIIGLVIKVFWQFKKKSMKYNQKS